MRFHEIAAVGGEIRHCAGCGHDVAALPGAVVVLTGLLTVGLMVATHTPLRVAAHAVVSAFVAAVAGGDLGALVQVLAPDVVLCDLRVPGVVDELIQNRAQK